MLFMMISCDHDKEETDLPIFHVSNDYGIPDSLLNDITRGMLDVFNKDNSISCKHTYVWDFTPNEQTICFIGIKEKHLWCKLIDIDGSIITEYLSQDTILDSYVRDIGYGEQQRIEFDYEKVEWGLDCYLKVDDSEIFRWFFPSICKYEFSSVAGFKSFYDNSSLFDMIRGTNNIFHNDICYSYKGDTLYVLTDFGKSVVSQVCNNNKENSAISFVSPENAISAYYDGRIIRVEKLNLRDEKGIDWSLQKETINNLYESGNKARTDFTIMQEHGSIWGIECIATGYSGTRIRLTIDIDVNNPPAELDVTEELLY